MECGAKDVKQSFSNEQGTMYTVQFLFTALTQVRMLVVSRIYLIPGHSSFTCRKQAGYSICCVC